MVITCAPNKNLCVMICLRFIVFYVANLDRRQAESNDTMYELCK